MIMFFGYFIAIIATVIFASISIGAIKAKDEQKKIED